jgi:hypothetical protein
MLVEPDFLFFVLGSVDLVALAAIKKLPTGKQASGYRLSFRWGVLLPHTT